MRGYDEMSTGGFWAARAQEAAEFAAPQARNRDDVTTDILQAYRNMSEMRKDIPQYAALERRLAELKAELEVA